MAHQQEIKLKLSAVLKEERTFRSFHTDWLSGNMGKDKFSLMSTAGCGGSHLYFNYKGRDYIIDCSDIPRQLIEAIDRKKTKLIRE